MTVNSHFIILPTSKLHVGLYSPVVCNFSEKQPCRHFGSTELVSCLKHIYPCSYICFMSFIEKLTFIYLEDTLFLSEPM